MTLNRKKLMAGVLGLSLGGLAAVAESPKPTLVPSLPTAVKPGAEVCQTPAALPAPLTIPAPPVAQQVAPPVAPTVPGPLAIPTIDVGTPAVITPAEIPPAPVSVSTSAKPVEIAPAPRRVVEQVVEFTLPMSAFEATPLAVPEPQQAVTQVSNPAPPAPPTPPVPPAPQDPLVPAQATPAPTAQLIPTTPPVPAQPFPTPPAPAPVAEPAPTPPMAAPVAEKKLRIVLNMGDDHPRFEVRDAEETLLKVICERVDVKSPTERGEPMSMMKATGSVKFITPGGVGSCDELSVVPGTGQVVVTGKVRFLYNWGKVETEVTGDRMTFRLGSTPGMGADAHPLHAIPASYNRVR